MTMSQPAVCRFTVHGFSGPGRKTRDRHGTTEPQCRMTFESASQALRFNRVKFATVICSWHRQDNLSVDSSWEPQEPRRSLHLHGKQTVTGFLPPLPYIPRRNEGLGEQDTEVSGGMIVRS
eukprot:748028-Hanusia_phi.AAC.3